MNDTIPLNTNLNIIQVLGDAIKAAVLSGSEMQGEEMPAQARERLVQYAALCLRVVFQRDPTPEEIGKLFGP